MILDEGFIDWHRKKDSRQAREWALWMEQNPSMITMVEEAGDLMNAIGLREKPVPHAQIARSLEMLQVRLESDAGQPPVIRSVGFRRWWWAAAILLVVAGTTGYFLLNRNSTPQFAAGYGELVKQELPDGSVVTLNANSKIELGKGFHEQKEREVWLKGEAFFQVKKTSDKKRFVVHTDRFDIVVTGTQFNVVNRGDYSNILLTEGSVYLRMPDGSDVKMAPGDYVELGAVSKVEKKSVATEKVLAWKDRKLVFESTSLKDAVNQIMDLYGVNIVIADSASATAPITGILPNDNLDVLLAALEAATGLHVNKQDENKILLTNAP